MADFSKWSRANLESVANDMLAALRHVLAMLDVAVSELSAKSGHRRNYMLQILHDAADRVEP